MRPALKSASTWLRLPWLKRPCKGSARTPVLRSLSATISAANWVATNTKVRLHACWASTWRSKRVRMPASTKKADWAISACKAGASLSSTRKGWCSRLLASASSAGAKVADKNKRCPGWGTRATMACTSSEKPCSNRRSASSSTRLCTRSRGKAWRAITSSKRPGVATMMSVPPRSARNWACKETPPNTVLTLTGTGRSRASSRSTSKTCRASSRVGTSTSTRTQCAPRAPKGAGLCKRCSRGSA